jgi:molecular chaperone Hsp33
MPGEIARCILAGGAARLVVALTTPAARESARRHQASGAAALALARGTTAGLLLSTLTKDQERVTLQVLGDGPLGGLTVDASSSGEVRAYLRNPAVRLPPLRAVVGPSGPSGPSGLSGRLSLAAAIGRGGIVHVVRDLGLREAFSGQTQIATGEIDDDVEHYLTKSEQIDSALACDAIFTRTSTPSAAEDRDDIAIAGGLLVQALPGSGGAEVVVAARERLRDGALLRALAERPTTAEALAVAALGDAGPDLLVLDSRPVIFNCPCSRDRAAASLMLMGPAELAAMIIDDGKAEVICNFCREHYDFDAAALEALRRETAPPSGPPS